MDGKAPTIAIPPYMGNLVYDESVLEPSLDVSELELVSNTRKLPMTKSHVVSNATENRNCTSGIRPNNVSNVTLLDKEGGSCMISGDAISEKSRGGQLGDAVSDQSITNASCSKMGINPETTSITSARGCNIGIMKSHSWGPNLMPEAMEDLISSMGIEDFTKKLNSPVTEVSQKLKIFCLNITPPWGITSIRGKRPEMEDAAVALPGCLKVPCQMLFDVPVTDATIESHTANLFGVYDGHGGAQVADYCRGRIHKALEEEMNFVKDELRNGTIKHDRKENWERVFFNCFRRVDDEVGGFSRSDRSSAGISLATSLTPIAPEAVGSTAVVAVVCPTHIIVANCGDSRAVLCRGKAPIALSTDHKPNREDEYSRIEATGGKVINWQGYRVSGVLAVSRSIGDRYLRPHVISDPELMITPRVKEDDCLILASDGLWDVLTNEEVCEVARRRILLWHKKNGVSAAIKEMGGEGIEPAAQDAAEYLSRLALRKGSKDNISVIVVDLKAKRKFKTKP